MKSLPFFFLCLLLFPKSISAQFSLQLNDEESKEGIEGVYVFVIDNNERKFSFLSNKNGKIESKADISYPISMTLQHLNYQTLTEVIDAQSEKIYFLKSTPYNLNAIVITGQYEPQSSENSLYTVRTISSERIKNQGALKLDEVLRYELNVRLNKDLATGTTSMQLQGIGGQNVKILIDGIPLTGRVGSSIDLEQINTYNIERIEMVEGPMAVNYGSDALAGIVNIITKKSSQEKLNIRLLAQEESAGEEYGTKEGIHNQNMSLGYNISEKFYTQLDFGRNYFGGFQGIYEGRIKEWNPKTQILGSSLVKFKTEGFHIFYRLDFLDEIIKVPGALQSNFTAIDEQYHTQRFIHQLQAGGKIKAFANFNTQFSYSDYERQKSRFVKDLTTLSETPTTAEGDQDLSFFRTWVFRGTLNHFSFLKNNFFDFELGYDINLEEGGGGRISGDNRSIQDFGFFASAEIRPLKNLQLRPGIRFAHNSIYEAPLVPSLNIKYNLTERFIFRAAYGRGFRAPALRELYFEFVDSNHNIYGNEDLQPEYAHHFDLSLTKQFSIKENKQFESQISGFYNDLDNQITIAGGFQDSQGRPAFKYINISKFKTLGFNLLQTFIYKNLKIAAGFSYIGRYNELSETEISLTQFLYATEANTSLNYYLKKWKLNLAIFYKYTGKLPQYNTDTNNEIFLAKTADFQWMDITLNKSFFNALNLSIGIKNLWNVQRIGTSAVGGVHGGGSAVPVGYGRSFLLRVEYHFKTKK